MSRFVQSNRTPAREAGGKKTRRMPTNELYDSETVREAAILMLGRAAEAPKNIAENSP